MKAPKFTKKEYLEIWDCVIAIIQKYPKDTKRAQKILIKIEKYLGFGKAK